MGWHGVTDPKYILLAVDYEPVEGILFCRLRHGIWAYYGVPENIYQCLLRNPFAGRYWRLKVRGEYPCEHITLEGEVATAPSPCPPDLAAVQRKQAIQAAKRLREVKTVEPMEKDLFGEVIPGSQAKKRGR